MTEFPLRMLTRYAPLVPVDLDQSFSLYNDLLGSKWQSYYQYHWIYVCNPICILEHSKQGKDSLWDWFIP